MFLTYLYRLETNDADSRVDQVGAEYAMSLPEYTSYKDIHCVMMSTFPKVTFERVATYLAVFQKILDEKCKYLYEERCHI